MENNNEKTNDVSSAYNVQEYKHSRAPIGVRKLTRTHARTQARTDARTQAHMHAATHARISSKNGTRKFKRTVRLKRV